MLANLTYVHMLEFLVFFHPGEGHGQSLQCRGALAWIAGVVSKNPAVLCRFLPFPRSFVVLPVIFPVLCLTPLDRRLNRPAGTITAGEILVEGLAMKVILPRRTTSTLPSSTASRIVFQTHA